MRFRNEPQLPGAGRTRAEHHHRSDTSTSPRAIYVLKSAKCNEIMPSVQCTIATHLRAAAINPKSDFFTRQSTKQIAALNS